MRIIAGEYRGRKIKMPQADAARPTQDRIREAIFNIIRERIPESKVLDLYAGSGAFGIEALSRGAHSAIFVDNNTICIQVIKQNLALIGVKPKYAQVFKMNAPAAIEKFQKKGLMFDMIFVDPPYYKDLAKNSLIKINACDILSRRGFVIAEHSKKDAMPDESGNLGLFKRKRYGDKAVSFYRKM